MGRKRTFGTSMGGLEKSPARKKREAKRRKAHEARWAACSGPVVVKRMDPTIGEIVEADTLDKSQGDA